LPFAYALGASSFADRSRVQPKDAGDPQGRFLSLAFFYPSRFYPLFSNALPLSTHKPYWPIFNKAKVKDQLLSQPEIIITSNQIVVKNILLKKPRRTTLSEEVLTRITTSCNRAVEESFPLPVNTSKTLLPLSPTALFCCLACFFAGTARFSSRIIVEDMRHFRLSHIKLLSNLRYRFACPFQDHNYTDSASASHSAHPRLLGLRFFLGTFSCASRFARSCATRSAARRRQLKQDLGLSRQKLQR
jgi:hypothetical protein